MALQKQAVPINFAQGIDLKTDPKQVQIGKMLALENSVFTKGGMLQKRNGYAELTRLIDDTVKYLTTFNDNLTAIGTSLSAYSRGSKTWVNKGNLHPIDVSVLPTVRSAANNPQADSAVSSNNLVCTAYTEKTGTKPTYMYVIADYETGQNIVSPTEIPVPTGSVAGAARVFALGNYFIIVFTNNISGTYHLQYIAVNINDPTSVTTAASISSQYTPTDRMSFAGVVANNNLYLAWNGSDLGGAIRATYISSTLTQFSTKVFAGFAADVISVTADVSSSTPIIYIAFNVDADYIYVAVLNQALVTILAPIAATAGKFTLANITITAANSLGTFFFEVYHDYPYGSPAKATHYIMKNWVSPTGTTHKEEVLIRSIGLASQAFRINDVAYMLTAYDSPYQPTYFLMDEDANLVAKLAYSNGGGYVTLGLPDVSVSDGVAKVAYLFKDLIASANKSQGNVSPTGVYSQTGVNLATFDFSPTGIVTSEIGRNLHLSGGFLWMYDGNVPVEHQFHVWPDNVYASGSFQGGSMIAQQYYYAAVYEWTDAQGNIFRSAPSVPYSVLLPQPTNKTFTSGDVITAADTITIASHGYSTGTAFTLTTAGTLPTPLAVATTYYVIRVDANTIMVAASYTDALVGTQINLTVAGAGTSTINITAGQGSATIYVPTLRLTAKTNTPVKLVIYRWSAAQQTYYQVTSISSPTLNDPSVDYLTFPDTQSDSAIIGNSILYTTGGVVENIAAPATNVSTLFKSRLFVLDSEDRNLLWYSKQVIEGVPVEMSDLFTIYVAPTAGAGVDTGIMTALTAMDDKLIIFKKNAIYYLTGDGPDNTGANNTFSEPVFITSTVGCDNQQSIVFMPQGIMFQSDKGIWLLGRDLSTSYIGAPAEEFNNSQVLSAVNVPETNQVRFTLASGTTLMYDYYFGQWGTFTNVPAVSSTVYQDLHTYINSYGRVFQENPGSYLDGANPVLLYFKTGWLNLAGLQGYERAYFFYILGTYITPHKLQIQIAYDYNNSPTQNTIVTPDNYAAPWGGEQLWGSSGPWGGPGNIEQWRIFLQTQKCQSFQISVKEIYDPSHGAPAGAGFTMSGIDLVVGVKSGYPRLRQSRSAG